MQTFSNLCELCQAIKGRDGLPEGNIGAQAVSPSVLLCLNSLCCYPVLSSLYLEEAVCFVEEQNMSDRNLVFPGVDFCEQILMTLGRLFDI